MKPKLRFDAPIIEYKGITKPLVEWARELKMPYNALHCRIFRLDWSVASAFNTPIKKKGRRRE
jgi:hypothetical protein